MRVISFAIGAVAGYYIGTKAPVSNKPWVIAWAENEFTAVKNSFLEARANRRMER